MKKRGVAILLLFALAFSLFACVGDTPPAGDVPGDTPQVTPPAEEPVDPFEPSPEDGELSTTHGYSDAGIFGGRETEVPTVRIITEKNTPITSKEVYLGATVSVSGDTPLSAAPARIRGRGNSSWIYFEKKSYRLKFDTRQDFLGMGAAKDFVLISSDMDRSFMQNYTALRLAAHLGADYVPECRFVHLYLNGAYAGLYLAAERIEEDEERIPLGDMTENPADCGYLVELGGNVDTTSPATFFMQPVEHNGQVYAWRLGLTAEIKHPDSDVCTPAHTAYIADYVNRVNRAIYTGDYKTFSALCDVDSFVRYFIVNEVMLNNDLDFSYYMYKKPGGKLYLGPVWDFDQACGMSAKIGNGYTGLGVNSVGDCWITSLPDMPEFREAVVAMWVKNSRALQAIPTDVEGLADYLRPHINRNYRRWKVLGQPYWRMTEEMGAFKTYPEFRDRLTRWLSNRIGWLETELAKWAE